MALGNINLDDRTYEQLLAVLKQHIPTQEWRDHNPSDPGIMLLELLAWLGEMSLYRMNRVPASHRKKFLKLIADPPQPVTTLVEFAAALQPSERPIEQPLVLPAGTRLATDFSNGRRFVFETLEELALTLPEHVTSEHPAQVVTGQVTARERIVIDSQRIGVSEGTADQVFAIKPARDLIETPDHPPQMSVPTGFTPALAGTDKLGIGSGIADVSFPESELEEALLLSYEPSSRALRLTQPDGSFEEIDLLPDAIDPDSTETASFATLLGSTVGVVLDESFDKTTGIAIDTALVNIVGGAGAIDPGSVRIVASRGLPPPQTSSVLSFSNLANPATAVITTSSGLSGLVNVSTGGATTVYLDDRWGRGFEVELRVTTAFDGNEESADIELRALENLLFLGISEEVRHSPWSEVLMDFVYRTPDYDPNPQVCVSAGITPALAVGSKLVADSGHSDLPYPVPLVDLSYPAALMGDAFLLSYLTDPPEEGLRLILERPGGPAQTVPITTSRIPPETAESVDFSDFGVQVELDHHFNKLVSIDIDGATVAVDLGTPPPPDRLPPYGTGAIDAGSVQIILTRGLIPSLGSVTLRLSNLSDPKQVVVTADGGFRGTVDLSTVGPEKIARLTDIWQRRLDIQFTVTTAFNGNEKSASIELHALDNLFFLGTLWEARRSLRTKHSRVIADSPVHHCHVDPFDSTLRFGDGTFGSIPPSGAEIVASYRVLQGPEALVRKDELEFLLDPPPLIETETEGGVVEESLSVSNKDADGGLRFFSPETRTAEALTDLNRTYRLVTADDFERVLLMDFNEFDAMAQAAPNVLSPEVVRARATANPTIRRAVAMMNCDTTLTERRGHVAILVLARIDPALDSGLLHDEAIPLLDKQAAVNLDQRLQDRILRFLDERRLITTRLSLTSARLKEVTLTTFVIVDRGRNVVEMDETLRTVLHDFFDIYTGYFEGGGWRLGRTVYRSEIYQILERVDGVDHVASLALSPADPNHNVALAPAELPILKLDLGIDRG